MGHPGDPWDAEVNLHEKHCVHVGMSENQNPQFPIDDEIGDSESESQEHRLNDPEQSPTEVDETKYYGADDNCDPPGCLAGSTNFRDSIDQESAVDHFLAEGRNDVDPSQCKQQHGQIALQVIVAAHVGTLWNCHQIRRDYRTNHEACDGSYKNGQRQQDGPTKHAFAAETEVQPEVTPGLPAKT